MTSDFIGKKKNLFDRWAPSYDWLFPSVIYQAIHKRLLEFVDLPENANVLDMGCGTGRLLDRLGANFPNLRGTGLDLSPQMLRIARRKNRHHPRMIFIEGKADALPFAEGQFDAVFSTISFLHYPEPEQVMAEVARVLKVGGCFYLVDISWKTDIKPPLMSGTGGIRLYSQQSREILGSSGGLQCLSHHYLLSPVLLTIFRKP